MGTVTHTYNPITWEAKAGGFSAQGQLGLNNDNRSLWAIETTLSQKQTKSNTKLF